jgi:DNA-binding response OmpR family regulator
MTETILIISNDTDFIEQVKAIGDYNVQIENNIPLDLAEILVCIVDVATVTIAADWIVENAKQSPFVIAFDDEQQIRPYLALIADFWMKPIHPVELSSRLRNLVNSHQWEQAYHNQISLMYFVLHEINDALVPIRGWTHIFWDSDFGSNLTEKQREIMSIILAHAKKIQTILYDHRDKNLDAG